MVEPPRRSSRKRPRTGVGTKREVKLVTQRDKNHCGDLSHKITALIQAILKKPDLQSMLLLKQGLYDTLKAVQALSLGNAVPQSVLAEGMGALLNTHTQLHQKALENAAAKDFFLKKCSSTLDVVKDMQALLAKETK